MKKSNILLGFLALFFSLTVSSCLNEDNKIPPNCFDGILNNGEELVDCGGPCEACDPCENGLWNPELGETWVDCGGDCGPCPTEANGCQDGDEEGVDCGGSTGIDCLSLCDDGLPNGYEDNAAEDCLSLPGSPPDCGGPCEPCPTCDDIIMNQGEIGIDCGGSGCPDCLTDGNCLNGFIDGDELYIDCYELADQPGYCPQCDEFMTCSIDGQAFEFVFNVNGTLAGGTVTATATDFDGNILTLNFTEPLSLWPTDPDGGLDGLPTLTDASGSTATYVDDFLGAGETFSAAVSYAEGGPGGTFNFTWLDVSSPGYVIGTFSGTMRTVSGLQRTFTNGKFRFIID